MRSEISFNYVA